MAPLGGFGLYLTFIERVWRSEEENVRPRLDESEALIRIKT